MPKFSSDGEDEHHRRVAEREEEPDRQRPLALADQLAGGVVDGGDVVGVERVPHAEGVGQHARAHAEGLAPADVVMPARDGGGEQAPSDHVQADDDAGHRADPVPLGGSQRGPDGGQAAAPVCHGATLSYLQITCNNARQATTARRAGANCWRGVLGLRSAGSLYEEVVPTVLSYPPTATGPDADDYHGELVADPYRWLEDTYSPQTAAWVAAQNELTQGWLARSADRERDLASGSSSWPTTRGTACRSSAAGAGSSSATPGCRISPCCTSWTRPTMPGGRCSTRTPCRPTARSPSRASRSATTGRCSPTRRAAAARTGRPGGCAIPRPAPTSTTSSSGRSRPCRVAERQVRFYYWRRSRRRQGGEYLAASGLHRIFFHRIGTAQSDDEIVFAQPGPPPTGTRPREVSDDGRFLIISVFAGTAPQTQLHVLDLTEPDAALRRWSAISTSIADVVATQGSTFYLVTDYQAERKRLVAVDLDRPDRAHWTRGRAARRRTPCSRAHLFGGKFVCHYLRTRTRCCGCTRPTARSCRQIPLPGYSLGGRRVQDRRRHRRPRRQQPDALRADLVHRVGLALVARPGLRRDRAGPGVDRGRSIPARFTRRAGASSPRPTARRVPMFLTRRDDVEPTGDVPCCSTGTADSTSRSRRRSRVLHAAWLDSGGLLAVANLRGGGEYGRAWHDARQARRQAERLRRLLRLRPLAGRLGLVPRRTGSRSRAAPTAGCWSARA